MAKRPLIARFLIALVAISLVACSSDPTPPSDLLLSAADFPQMNLTEIVQETGFHNDEAPAVQVQLRANGFIILQSLVLFENRDSALEILTSIKRDQTAQGVASVPVGGFEDNSGVMIERSENSRNSTVFFVEGRALVKITVSGEEASASIWEIAARARERSAG